MKILLSLIRIIYRLTVNWLKWCWRYGIALTLFSVLFVAFVPASTLHYEDVYDRISLATSDYHFDFVSWEVNAIGAKAESVLFGQSAYMSETDRSDYVRDYMADLAHLQSIDAQIARIFNDPTIDNPQF